MIVQKAIEAMLTWRLVFGEAFRRGHHTKRTSSLSLIRTEIYIRYSEGVKRCIILQMTDMVIIM